MIKKLLFTAFARLIGAAATLFMVVAGASLLGPEQYGRVALFLLAVTILALATDLVTGGMVYFASRYPQRALLIRSYMWTVLIAGLATLIGLVLSKFPVLYEIIVPAGTAPHIIIVAVLASFCATHQNILLGLEKIKQYNISVILQYMVLPPTFILLIWWSGSAKLQHYIYSLYLSYIVGWLVAAFFSRRFALPAIQYSIGNLNKEIFIYTSATQLANLTQLGSRRISYYFINGLLGSSALGIYNAAVQLTEGIRMITQSIALVQFGHISNDHNEEKNTFYTKEMLWISGSLTLLALAVILIIPESWFLMLLSSKFIGIKPIMLILAPGVLALSLSMIFSHHFSGSGIPVYNFKGSLLGFIITLTFVWPLVASFQHYGAAIVASLAYISSFLYQGAVFSILYKKSISFYLIDISDYRELKDKFKKIWKRT
mgnify:FL=1